MDIQDSKFTIIEDSLFRGMRIVKIKTTDCSHGENLSTIPSGTVDIQIHTKTATYFWSYSCGWQVADFLSGSATGRVTAHGFKPRCDSFIGRVLQSLGIETVPLDGKCSRSCCC